jgi:hypothetical protein
MGVLNCDRKGCENIMCDYYSHTHGYLCWECRDELLNSYYQYNSIYAFMGTPKNKVNSFEGLSYDDVIEEFEAT